MIDSNLFLARLLKHLNMAKHFRLQSLPMAFCLPSNFKKMRRYMFSKKNANKGTENMQIKGTENMQIKSQKICK